MLVKLMSDLHLDLDRTFGRDFLESLDGSNIDLLILAGDILTFRDKYRKESTKVLAKISQKFKLTLYVPGNHEWWFSSFKEGGELMAEWGQKFSNIKFLTRYNPQTIGKTKFVGCTMWYPKSYEAEEQKRYWPDFKYIWDSSNIYEENAKDIKYLKENVDENTFVITHHLPHRMAIHPRFKMVDTNCYFLCDQSELIAAKNPKFWAFGHTHQSCDFKIGPTRLICNARGYLNEERDAPYFDKDLTIEV